MLGGLLSATDFPTGRAAWALGGGGVLMLLGLVLLVLFVATAGPSLSARHRFRRGLLLLGSTLLVFFGGSVVLGVGLVFPLRRAIPTLSGKLDRLARLQSEQLTLAILGQERYRDPKTLGRYECKFFSQNGEDGIIAEIFRRTGTTNRHFVEFGASDGSENNTAFLLRQGWTGLWMDGDTGAVKKARTDFAAQIARHDLTVLEAFITAENIEDLFRQGKVPEEFDLLSIDIDRNDYHVWERITNYRPRCVVIEYNATFPPSVSWVVPYDPKAWGWNAFGTGNGASLKALEELGARKGYCLVGCDLGGVNAFFVREDLVGDHFTAPYTADRHYEPFRAYLLQDHLYERSTLEP